jgi:hypothetical protein
MRRHIEATLWATCVFLAACGGKEPAPKASDSAVSAAPAVTTADTVTTPAPAAVAPLDSAARAVLAFLRREKAFSTIVLADSVEIYVGKDAGGTRTMYAREELQRPSMWVGRSKLGNYKFAPPSTHVVSSVKRGVHFNCTERKLAESFPQLARRPHVGVMLEPEFRENCMQTWNVTFVFDDSIKPRLIAAVYDQFEW